MGYQNSECNSNKTDFGPIPYTVNLDYATNTNNYFRRALWTGNNLQVTLMSIPVGESIGLEIHKRDDQMIYIENGNAIVQFGTCSDPNKRRENVGQGFAAFIPAGTWHNVINNGNLPLKVFSVYAPPHHPRGTINVIKPNAE